MPLGGFMTTDKNLSFMGVVLAGTLGSVLGALPLYYLGKYLSEERLKTWADTHGKWLLITKDDIEKAIDWFEAHGSKAVFFCRLVPGVRSLISIPAGSSNMNMMPFLLYTTLGTGLWAALLAYAGRVLGQNYEDVGRYLQPITYGVVGLLVVGAIWWYFKRR